MFGIDAIEFILLLVLAVIMFGPEKLPEFSRKAARIFVALRDIANNAQSQLRTELGPEFADLELKDLNPKAFVAKHMQAEIKMLDDTKRELEEAQRAVKETTKLATDEAKAAAKDVKDRSKSKASSTSAAKPEPKTEEPKSLIPAVPEAPPFHYDEEAT